MPDVLPLVHLVGAGPGDPELLTLKAVRVIRQATLLLVDDLVSDAVLREALGGLAAPPRVVHVGKRAGCASTPQGFIERLMVREALAGERVVRLKGGEPLLFGRAGEEIAALREAGVRVEVVNGITAGLAAAGALQASWTDRRHAAHGVMLVTGHAQPGARGPDWDAIGRAAASGMTLVLYMGVAQAAHIVARLRAWLPGDVPAAIVQHASGPDERRALTTLDGLVQRLEHDRFGSPAVWIVGQVLDSAPALAAARDAVRAAGPMPAPAPRAPGARIG